MRLSRASPLERTVSAIAALLRRQVGVQQQPDHADDAVHGRADLVAHVGQELALGDVGRLGLDGQLVGTVGGGGKPQVGLFHFFQGLVQVTFRLLALDGVRHLTGNVFQYLFFPIAIGLGIGIVIEGDHADGLVADLERDTQPA